VEEAGIVVMGVCASGKSAVGKLLAERLSLPFEDGDAYHAKESVDKMEAGIALDDADRWPWLEKVGSRLAAAKGKVIACSALKKTYRQHIQNHAGRPVIFVYLAGERDVLVERMKRRTAHFMPMSLLDSQLKTLEVPAPEERAVTVDIDAPLEAVVNQAIAQLQELERQL